MATLTTPRLAIPYPDGNELVRNGDDAMGAIATTIDGLCIPYRMAAGTANVVASGSVTNPSVVVNFPAGRFTQAPIVIAQMNIASTKFLCNVSQPTTTSCTITVFHNTDGTNVAAATYFVGWLAIQMLPGAAPG